MANQMVDFPTNQILKSFEEMSVIQLDEAITEATYAFTQWRKTCYERRADLLHKVAFLMRDQQQYLARLITMEMGKLAAQAEDEISLSADIFDYYADNRAKFFSDKPLAPQYGKAIIHYAPASDLPGTESWNFPFYQVAWFAAPNIMVGNTVLVKHASIVPQCAIAVENLFKDAGAPKGIYTNLLISGKRTPMFV